MPIIILLAFPLCSLSGFSVSFPSKLFFLHISSSTTTGTITAGTSATGGVPDFTTAAAPAQTGPCPEPKRYRPLLVCCGNRPQLRRCRYLSPVRLSPGQPGDSIGHWCFGSVTVEEDRGGEGTAAAHGVHLDPVCVRVDILFCREGERCVRPLRSFLWTAVHWRH